MARESLHKNPVGTDFSRGELQYTSHSRYRDYQYSGVVWLQRVPTHWHVQPLKRLGGLQAGAGFPEDEQGDLAQEIPFFKVGDMGSPRNVRELQQWQHTVSRETARKLRAHVFPANTVVFAKVGAALMLNRRRVLVQPSCIDNNMMGFVPISCDPKWAFYALCAFDIGVLANPGAVPSVNEVQMRDIPVVVPPPPEQRAIAAFLDRETAKIDALVAKKERLIELLQERRSALISQAVTKGLDPNVPMKQSHIEWLGKIPRHWKVKKLRRWASLIQTGSTPPTGQSQHFVDGTVPWHGPSSFSTDLLLRNAVRMVTEGAIRQRVARLFPRGSTMIVTIGATLGRVGLVKEPSSCNQQITTVNFDPKDVDGKFGAYQLKRLESVFAGVAPNTTLPILNQWQIGDFAFAAPPLDEQGMVIAFLDREIDKIVALMAKVRTALDRLKELRMTLISAAVTGKIDVRDEADPNPGAAS
ncbi:MAG: restriction endonuclease subunit S [Deltaproteobacteria bacterium]|nr:restriction endonuclease subunit S [Deltaproteobacteria bacterium]